MQNIVGACVVQQAREPATPGVHRQGDRVVRLSAWASDQRRLVLAAACDTTASPRTPVSASPRVTNTIHRTCIAIAPYSVKVRLAGCASGLGLGAAAARRASGSSRPGPRSRTGPDPGRTEA